MITLLLIILSAIAHGSLKGEADTIQTSEEYRLNGWKAKWKDVGERIEKFPFSSTMLVWTTDKWHLFNFLQYRITDSWIIYVLHLTMLTPSGMLWLDVVICLCLFAALAVFRWFGFKMSFRR